MPLTTTLRGLPLLLAVGVLTCGPPCAQAFGQPTAPEAAHTDPINLIPEVKEAHTRFYNLDYDGALAGFQAVAQAYPDDPMASAYVLLALVFRELYQHDLLDTTLYAHEGFLSSKRKVGSPESIRKQIEDLTDSTVALCDRHLRSNSQDKNALFARSYVRALHATFITLVDHSFVSAARQGLQARGDSEAVLRMDPDYMDAKLVIGVQQFAVASLPRVLRMVVGIAGVGGSKGRGLDLLREVAAHSAVNSVEARTALSLFLRHDASYDEALAVEQTLIQQYPHDFLFRLESANITKDKGDGPTAIAEYRAVLSDARHPNFFIGARLQLAWFGLADTLRGQNQLAEAAAAYRSAASQPSCSDWLRQRAQLNAGEVFDLLQQRDHAVEQYQLAEEGGADPSESDLARHHLKSPYPGH